mgnify:CR=1 FL=1
MADSFKAAIAGIIIGLAILYTLAATSLGAHPRGSAAEIDRQKLEAARAEYDRVCERPRP